MARFRIIEIDKYGYKAGVLTNFKAYKVQKLAEWLTAILTFSQFEIWLPYRVGITFDSMKQAERYIEASWDGCRKTIKKAVIKEIEVG